MSQKSKPLSLELPFRPEIGNSVGSGQDNRVFQLVGHAEKPHLRAPVGSVLKINHKNPHINYARHPDEREAAWRGLKYKKNKYELLKLFLGDFVPDTAFVLGKVHEGRSERYAEFTVQQEVPRVSLSDLTSEQREDPRLISQVTDLMSRLQYMYDVLGEVNARSDHKAPLDGTLNLGGVSGLVRSEGLDHRFTAEDAENIINENGSPNLLVDPATMQLYCIDFGQGQWTDSMDRTKAMAEQIVSDDRRVSIGKLAVEA
jgi:hypothetical protein